MKLIDKLRDLDKATIASLFEHARDAATNLGGRRADVTVTLGEDADSTDTFEGFEGMECSLTFTVKPPNGN